MLSSQSAVHTKPPTFSVTASPGVEGVSAAGACVGAACVGAVSGGVVDAGAQPASRTATSTKPSIAFNHLDVCVFFTVPSFPREPRTDQTSNGSTDLCVRIFEGTPPCQWHSRESARYVAV